VDLTIEAFTAGLEEALLQPVKSWSAGVEAAS
jgi:hypothetical protein